MGRSKPARPPRLHGHFFEGVCFKLRVCVCVGAVRCCRCCCCPWLVLLLLLLFVVDVRSWLLFDAIPVVAFGFVVLVDVAPSLLVWFLVGTVVVTIAAPRGDGGYCSWLFVLIDVINHRGAPTPPSLVVRHRGSGTPFATCCCDVAAM